MTVWAYISQDHYWRDIGTPRSYLKVHEELLSGQFESPQSPQRGTNAALKILLPPLKRGFRGILIHPEAVIEPGVKFSGWACIGKGCLLKTGCQIRNSVLWEDVTVEIRRSPVSESILGQGVHLKNDLHGGVMI